jgi:hypothetical protein
MSLPDSPTPEAMSLPDSPTPEALLLPTPWNLKSEKEGVKSYEWKREWEESWKREWEWKSLGSGKEGVEKKREWKRESGSGRVLGVEKRGSRKELPLDGALSKWEVGVGSVFGAERFQLLCLGGSLHSHSELPTPERSYMTPEW